MPHECLYTKEIEAMMKTLYGNGQPGLIETSIRTDENLKQLTEITEKLATGVNGLLKFMNETKGRDRGKTVVYWLIGLLITSVIGFGGLIIALIK